MKSNINIQYLTDQDGNKTAVLIPIADWLDLSSNLSEFLEYQSMKSNLTGAFEEVEEMKKGNQEKVLLTDFLKELD